MYYEIFGTAALFGTIFMLSEPVTGATREEGRLLSSIVAGLLLVGYNYFGAYQQGILFVVLLMNIINHRIDTVTEKRMQKERRARYAKREAAGDQ
jgi:electron transport complex protein RnfD